MSLANGIKRQRYQIKNLKVGIYFMETTIVFIIAIPLPVETLSEKNCRQLRILKYKICISQNLWLRFNKIDICVW